jgi:hypothetical protein
MKTTCLILSLLVSVISSGQREQRVAVPGTKVSLVPPKGFVPSEKYAGFQNAEIGASIVIVELPAAYESVKEGFSGEGLRAMGMTLLDTQMIDLNHSGATWVRLSQKADSLTYLKQAILFGDSTKTILVSAAYPEDRKSIENDIRASLLTVAYDAGRDDNPLQAASFTIDPGGSGFVFTKLLMGGLLYTKDGMAPTNSPDKAMIIVSPSFNKIETADKKQYSIDRLKKIPGGESAVIKEVNTVTIDSMSGFEVVANAATGGTKPQLIYEVMLFDSQDNYYIFIGSTLDNHDAYLTSFRTIAKTFKRK